MTEREVVRVGRQSERGVGGRRRRRKEVSQQSRVDAFRSILVGKGRKPGVLFPRGEFLGFPYRRGGEGREVARPMGEFGLLDGREIGASCRALSRLIVGVP